MQNFSKSQFMDIVNIVRHQITYHMLPNDMAAIFHERKGSKLVTKKGHFVDHIDEWQNIQYTIKTSIKKLQECSPNDPAYSTVSDFKRDAVEMCNRYATLLSKGLK